MKSSTSASRDYGSARNRIIARYGDPAITPPRPSMHIRYAKELSRERPGQKAILCVRVSSKNQERNDNRADQEANLRSEAEKLGFEVIDVLLLTKRGSDEERTRLELTVERARRIGAILLAESPDRFIRSWWFSVKRNPSAQPTIVEWDRFLTLIGNVTLATIVHPDLGWRAIRGYQTNRGVAAKGGKPSNPKPGAKKERRERLLHYARELRNERLSLRKIGAAIDVPWSTIRDWLNRP
jgi:hypothetical protein